MNLDNNKNILNNWRFLLLGSLISAVLIFGGYYYYNYSAKQIKYEKENGLKAIASLKIDQLVYWHKEKNAEVEVISSKQLFVAEIQKWLNDKNNILLTENILNPLALEQEKFGYENIFLTSPQGNLLLSVDNKVKKIDVSTAIKISEASKTGKITFTDFYYCNTHKKIHYDIIAPIITKKRETIGLLVFRIDPSIYIFPLIQSWPTPSKTAETLLFKKEGDSVLYLSQLRHQKNTALILRLPLSRKNLPAAQAIIGKTGIFYGKDYRGIDVISYLSAVPRTDWFIAAKVDKKEIFAEINFRGIIISIVILLLILFLTVGIVWIYNFRQMNLYKSLLQIQEEFRTTLYSIGDAVISTGKNGRIINMNYAAEKITGWMETEAAGKPLTEVFRIINANTRESVDNPVEKVLENGQIFGLANHTILISKNENEYQISDSAAPIKNKEGEIIGVVLVFKDITENYAAEKALRESEEFSRLLLQTIPFGMDIVDQNGIILFQSENLKKHFNGEETLGKKCWELYCDTKTQCLECPLKGVIEVGKTSVIESAEILGGKIFEILHTGMVYKSKKAMLEIFVDITERKQNEIELINAKERAQESNRLKSAFLANISHEIRTPMNGILGFSDLLKTPDLSNEKQQKYIDIIEKSGARMLNIINDIVDISKIESGQMKVNIQESNINKQAEFVYTFFKLEAEAKGIQFFFKNKLPAKEATIETDREKVYAILTNLVKNAIKYTEHGSITFGYEKKGKYLEFCVKDTGIGIPKNRQSAIFERFIQADIVDKMALQGAGLGLSIAKAYIEMLGGKIWVESEEGKGSTFYFTLPYQNKFEEKEIIKNLVMVGSEKNKIKNLKILVVDDDETSEMLLPLMLEENIKEILNAHTGVEAIEKCRNNPDIDLVLMDIQMPKMDGYEATRQIRQFNKEVVIIAQTAYGLSEDREKTINAGCNEYISKPINKNELDDLIKKYFK